jgi:hypothetical protein
VAIETMGLYGIISLSIAIKFDNKGGANKIKTDMNKIEQK